MKTVLSHANLIDCVEPQAACTRVFKERSAQRRPHGIVRTDELPERPEWSTAGTTDILPAVHIPELFTYRQ